MNMNEQIRGLLDDLEVMGLAMHEELKPLVGRIVRITAGSYTGREAKIKGHYVNLRQNGQLEVYFWLEIPKTNGEPGVVWAKTDARRAYAPEELELQQ